MQNFLISADASARDALRQLNMIVGGIVAPVLFVIDINQRVLGSLTDGDIRRGLLNNLGIDENVKIYMNTHFRFVINDTYTKSDIQRFRENKIRFIPVLNQVRQFVKVIDAEEIRSNIPVSAVIMAGGRGERLMPLTENTPKPMLKIGKKPIIEYNIDQLIRYGITDITISIRYLGEQIQSYFGNGSERNSKINYLTEDIPLGTIGALRQIGQLEKEHVLIMNSDLLTNIDFEQFYEAFLSNQADMAVATVPYHVNVPYAVMELKYNEVIGFKEKPKYTYYSNAGIYLLKKEMINLIPENKKYDTTDLMNNIITSGKKLIAEPILGYWLDIGRIEDFYKAQEDIKYIRF